MPSIMDGFRPVGPSRSLVAKPNALKRRLPSGCPPPWPGVGSPASGPATSRKAARIHRVRPDQVIIATSMPPESENQQIWSQIPGSAELLRRYGYCPTFHDAHILDVVITDHATTVQMEFYYYDAVDEGLPKQDWGRDLHTLITMRWQGVRRFLLPFQYNWLSDMSFSRSGNSIVTRFNEQESGEEGIIESEALEVAGICEPPEAFRRLDGRNIDFWFVRSG